MRCLVCSNERSASPKISDWRKKMAEAENTKMKKEDEKEDGRRKSLLDMLTEDNKDKQKDSKSKGKTKPSCKNSYLRV